jgi:hypothetical protein
VARRGELKHLSTPRKRKKFDFVSSGERKRNSLNLMDVKLRGVVYEVSWGSMAGDSNLRRKEISSNFNRTVWKDWPKKVTALYVKKLEAFRLSTPSTTI